MLKTLCVIFVSLCVLNVFCEEAKPITSDVVELTSANYNDLVKEGLWLVEYFAPWCGHCKKLAPTYEHLATTLKGKFNIAKVDCTSSGDVCSGSGVTGYPTIKLLENGQEKEKYAGPRTAAAIANFLKDKAGLDKSIEVADLPGTQQQQQPPAQKVVEEGPSDAIVLTEADFQIKIAEGYWFVKFYAPWCGHCKSLAPTWNSLATELKGKANIAKVDCTTQRAACTANGVKGFPTLILFKDGVEVEKYNGPRGSGDLVKFMKKNGMLAQDVEVNSVPAKKEQPAQAPPAQEEGPSNVVNLGGDNFDQSIQQGAWFVKFYAPWCGHCKKLAPTWNDLATKINLSNKAVKIAKVDCTQHGGVCSGQGVRGYPTIKLFVDGKSEDYRGSRELNGLTSYLEQRNLLVEAAAAAPAGEVPAAAAGEAGEAVKHAQHAEL